MDNFWLKKGLKMVALVAFYIVFFGSLTKALWNWLMPPLFGLSCVTFFQALGLFVLGRIMTGGVKILDIKNVGNNKEHWEQKKEIYQKWQEMSAEERERWRENWREKCRTRRSIGFHKNENEKEKQDMI